MTTQNEMTQASWAKEMIEMISTIEETGGVIGPENVGEFFEANEIPCNETTEAALVDALIEKGYKDEFGTWQV